MKTMKIMKMAFMACGFAMIALLSSCNLDLPKETQTSFETMTVKKSDIEVPVKFSAKMKGQADVTITPQVSGQLMKIYVTEGQQVSKGQTLFVIDSRNAQHELESARANLQAANANLQAAISQSNSAKLEYESNKNLYDKQIVSNYMLESSLNTYKQAQATVSQAKASVSQAQAAVDKHDFYQRQVEVLKLAYKGTHELMDNGKASYLEVLTAQERLLNAQLNQAVNMYNGAQGLIALYIALGGATR